MEDLDDPVLLLVGGSIVAAFISCANLFVLLLGSAIVDGITGRSGELSGYVAGVAIGVALFLVPVWMAAWVGARGKRLRLITGLVLVLHVIIAVWFGTKIDI
jgi:hypothetical protein